MSIHFFNMKNRIKDNNKNLSQNLFSVLIIQIIFVLDVTDAFIKVSITNFYFNFILLYWIKKNKLEDNPSNNVFSTPKISYINFFATLFYVPDVTKVCESYNLNLPLTEEEFEIFYIVGILTGQILDPRVIRDEDIEI